MGTNPMVVFNAHIETYVQEPVSYFMTGVQKERIPVSFVFIFVFSTLLIQYS